MQTWPEGVQVASETGVPKVKLSLTVDQTMDREVPKISEEKISEAYTRYKLKLGTLPSPGDEPTEDQLTAVDHLLNAGVPPYVDFSIFGPFPLRLRKRLMLRGLALAGDGTVTRQEIYGPPSFDEWMRSYRVLSRP